MLSLYILLHVKIHEFIGHFQDTLKVLGSHLVTQMIFRLLKLNLDVNLRILIINVNCIFNQGP